MRKTLLLRKRYAHLLSYVCRLLCLFGGIMLIPLVCLLFWHDAGDFTAFALPGILLAVSGGLGWMFSRRNFRFELSLAEGGVIVLLAWLGTSLAAAIPFMLASTGLSFTHAVFESVSGLTTTGLSLVDVTTASHGILLWRSILQIVGGAGLAIMMAAALIGPSSTVVSAAEGRADQLVPNVRRSARLVLALLTGYICFGVAAYCCAGLTVFDAVTHTFTAVATGGFSTHPESIGYWNSAVVEGITIMLMLLGNLNFVTAWILVRGNLRAFLRNGEIRLLAMLVVISASALFMVTAQDIYPLGKAVRAALFESISALTGTGFTSTDYAMWNPFGFAVLTVLMVVGGGACSTSGALKQFRVYVLLKSIYWEIRRALLPRNAVLPKTVWEGEYPSEISDSRLWSIAAYTFLYLAWLAGGTAILTAYGHGVQDSLFEYASALGTVGLSTGITNPDAPSTLIWVETAGMFFGRLEFFVIVVSTIKLIRDLARMFRRLPAGADGNQFVSINRN